MRKIFAFIALFLAVTASVSASVVDTVAIGVNLQHNGDALIHELWNIDVDDSIKEWYLVADNMNGRQIRNLTVFDESGQMYITEDAWNINRSRAEKAGRCGLVTKPNGYEICWGVGSSGPHRYFVSYELTDLITGHDDMDGFNHMFVTRGLGSSPNYIEVRISAADTVEFTEENAKIWAFGFKGEVEFEDGDIVARTSERFTKESGLIVMAGFQKGIFNPKEYSSESFDSVRADAFENSDYVEKELSWFEKLLAKIIPFFVAALFIVPISITIFKRKKRERELMGGPKKEIAWFRGVPAGGSLHASYSVLKCLDISADLSKNLTAAYMTRLFYNHAFTITLTADGKPAIKVLEYVPDTTDPDDATLQKDLYDFFKEAAGEDSVLEKKEFRKWMRKNGERAYEWKTFLESSRSLWQLQSQEVREVLGLKKFLKDFTLIQDRGVVEIGLWNNYLIFASLFGIADKLKDDFKKVCPEYFKLVQEANSAVDMDAVGTGAFMGVVNEFSRGIYDAADHYSDKVNGSSGSSGGGGSASFGGGGGFSGGGYGGGGR